MSDDRLARKLRHIETLEQLEAALGPLSAEERALLDAMSVEPTPEELEAFRREHPDFTERVLALARERHPGFFPPTPTQTQKGTPNP
jgi:hypothetical protein